MSKTCTYNEYPSEGICDFVDAFNNHMNKGTGCGKGYLCKNELLARCDVRDHLAVYHPELLPKSSSLPRTPSPIQSVSKPPAKTLQTDPPKTTAERTVGSGRPVRTDRTDRTDRVADLKPKPFTPKIGRDSVYDAPNGTPKTHMEQPQFHVSDTPSHQVFHMTGHPSQFMQHPSHPQHSPHSPHSSHPQHSQHMMPPFQHPPSPQVAYGGYGPPQMYPPFPIPQGPPFSFTGEMSSPPQMKPKFIPEEDLPFKVIHGKKAAAPKSTPDDPSKIKLDKIKGCYYTYEIDPPLMIRGKVVGGPRCCNPRDPDGEQYCFDHFVEVRGITPQQAKEQKAKGSQQSSGEPK